MGNIFSHTNLFGNNPTERRFFGKKKTKSSDHVFPLGVIMPLYSDQGIHNEQLVNQSSISQMYNNYPPYLINENISSLSIKYTANINNFNQTVRDSSVYIVEDTPSSSTC